jgi:hypothetical protein
MILFETHPITCSCSYCKVSSSLGDDRLHYGLNIPNNKSWNSWWVIKWGHNRYIRWTNPWMRDWRELLWRFIRWTFTTALSSVVAFVVFQILLHWWPLK